MKTIPLTGAEPCRSIDLPDEGRTGVLEVKNTNSWHVAQCDLSEYAQQHVTIKFSTEVKRIGASGNLGWTINNNRYPTVGNEIKKAKTDIWYSMAGEWSGVLTDENPLLYLNAWKNNSEKTTYYIDRFSVHITVNTNAKDAIKPDKTYSDMAAYLKNLVPVDIPATYSLKPLFKNISNDESIFNGVRAFKEFLYQLYDRFIADGNQYEKQKKETDKIKSHFNLARNFPFIHQVISVLNNIGYHSVLASGGDVMTLCDRRSLGTVINGDGAILGSKISGKKVAEALQFLETSGMYFDGIDLDVAKPDLMSNDMIEITYPDDPNMLVGLKTMAIAQRELEVMYSEDVFMRCDYKVLRNEEVEIIEIVKDFINPFPEAVQLFTLDLHERYITKGLNCSVKISGLQISIIYAYKKTPVWEFAASLGSGHRIFIKALNIHTYVDLVSTFSPILQDTIARGFGCERRRYGMPCESGCHGFSIPLNETMLTIGKDIKTWIDRELMCIMKK